MIKINLLEVEKERRGRKTVVATGGGGGGGGIPTAILALVIIGLALAAFLVHYFVKKSNLAALKKEVAQLTIRKKELEPYIKRVDELERRRNELAKKNYAIEELRSNRTIPVHIMDEISRSLPEYLWLTVVSLKGPLLSIDGETLQEQAIPTFMKNLDASQFIGTTRLIETKQRTASGASGISTTFKISAPITNPFKPKAPPEPPASAKKKTTKKKGS
jgi:type IV pilus assembly protein PilN